MPPEPRPSAPPASELERLCTSCGLCCDGSLFGRVTLRPEEVAPARNNRLRVVSTGTSFEQPCSALVGAGTGARIACRVYDERPASCRRFACRLHDRFRREGGPIEPRLAAVHRVRELLAVLEASGFDAADFEGNRADHEPGESLRTAYLELVRLLEEDFARA